MIKVSDYIAKRISKETDVVFGITGGAIVHLFDSLEKCENIKLVPMHHEQAAAMAADAYTRVSKKLGVVCVTSGPGATNLITGTCCSWFDSIPVLTIAGQVPTKDLKEKHRKKLRQFGFQETNTVSLFKSITKFCKRVEEVEKDLETSIFEAKKDRKGPVFLELCDDTQRSQIEENGMSLTDESLMPKESEVKKVLGMIENSNNPILIIGAGVKLANAEIVTKQLINLLAIPVFLTWGAMDLLSHKHPYNCRDFGVTSQRIGNFAVKNADLIICLGTKLDTHEVIGNWTNAKLVMVDIDEEELKKQDVDLKIHCSLYHFIDKLTTYSYNHFFIEKTKKIERIKKIQELRKKYPLPETMPYKFVDKLSDYAKGGDIIITDAGQTLAWTMQGWKVKEGQKLFSAFNHSPMGYALPASIGAWYGKYWYGEYKTLNGENIICITGDGGLQMNLQELQTIVGNNLPIKIFVLDNKGYGILKQTQSDWSKQLKYKVATEPPMGDLRKIAGAFGLKYYEIKDEKELYKAEDVLKDMQPVMCVVKIPDGTKIQLKLKYGDEFDDLTPKLSEKERRKINEAFR